MTPSLLIYRKLARRYAVAEFSEEGLIQKGEELCAGRRPRWVAEVAKVLANAFAETKRPRFREIEEQLREIPSLEKALQKGKSAELPVAIDHLPESLEMFPVGAAEDWGLPDAVDFSSLAVALELHPDDLGWLLSKSKQVEHYHYRWHSKGAGREPRLIEIPKPLLRTAQTAILDWILSPVPVHESCCGFEKGKSIFDFVRPHCGREMVLKMDLKDFFAGIGGGRVTRLFMTGGYPEYVAEWLTRLTTNGVKDNDDSPLRKRRLSNKTLLRYEMPHLPQGASTSPSLANLCAFRLDCRLAGLARAAGVSYTRYADDILFSGGKEFRRSYRRLFASILEVIIDSGFCANLRKTRFMPNSQRQFAAGLILNEKPNVKREEFDRLKATLHNCARLGMPSQNQKSHPAFREHLQGRIEWVAASNLKRGEKLRRIFAEVEWEDR